MCVYICISASSVSRLMRGEKEVKRRFEHPDRNSTLVVYYINVMGFVEEQLSHKGRAMKTFV